jgi:hypothetical protein
MVVNRKTAEGARAYCAAIYRPRCSNKRWLRRFMSLSCRNLPCALKAAIAIGKRTLGDPQQDLGSMLSMCSYLTIISEDMQVTRVGP